MTDDLIEFVVSDILKNGRAYKPGDSRAFYKAMKERTGFRSIRYDCCIDSCVSYSGKHALLTECPNPKCRKPRWKDPDAAVKESFKTHVYFPMRHRIMLWFTSRFMSRLLTTYRRKATVDALTRTDEIDCPQTNTGISRRRSRRKLTDFWSGKLFRDLRKLGYFDDYRDLGFVCGFDGTKAFKSRKNRYVWPIILTCLNIPPEIRYKRKNVLISGFIPGPKNPVDVDSFMEPLVKEFEELSVHGVSDVWDAASPDASRGRRWRPGVKEHPGSFTLKAHLVLVTTDMPARTKILHMKGLQSSSYCEYCTIKGLQYGGMYPHDLHDLQLI